MEEREHVAAESREAQSCCRLTLIMKSLITLVCSSAVLQWGEGNELESNACSSGGVWICG